MLSVQWYHHHYVKIGPVCKKVQTFPYNNVLYIRTDRKEKFWVQNSWWFRANKLSSQYFTERTSVRLSRNIWCSYYSLLSPSSVWSGSSSSRTKKIEFELISECSQGPDSWITSIMDTCILLTVSGGTPTPSPHFAKKKFVEKLCRRIL